MARIIPLEVPNLTAPGIIADLRHHGCRVDSYGERLIAGVCNTLDSSRVGHLDHVILTPRELGCTEHPTIGELFAPERLNAYARECLPPGKMLDFTNPEALASFCVSHPEERSGVIVAAMRRVFALNAWAMAQSVQLPFTGEWWFYGVPCDDGKRWSLGHRFLFRVCDDLRLLIPAQMPQQAQPSEHVVCTRRPTVLGDEVPGLFCGQMAIKSILGSRGEDADIHDLCVRGPYGRFFNKTGHTTNVDIAMILRKHGFNAKARFWGQSDFSLELERSIRDGKMIDLLINAQRRRHLWHSQVVSGFEVYRGHKYWYVTDPQFDKNEYVLPHGNSLLSTSELVGRIPLRGTTFPILAVEIDVSR